jgi:16S rRNA G966 N2-methylase RsmD
LKSDLFYVIIKKHIIHGGTQMVDFKNGKIICEHEKDLEMPEKISNSRLQKNYFYGKIVVSVYAFEEEESE